MITPRGAPTAALVELSNVTKVFPNGTTALREVDLSVRLGSVHGLVGANGAGKSTVIKILSGAIDLTSGRMAWKGEERWWRDPGEAKAAGIVAIQQHIPLVPTLSVLENVFLGRGGWLRSSTAERREFDELLARVGYHVDPHSSVGDLPIGQRQMVAILQALASGAELVIMDEPTASLAQGERELVFEVIRRLSGENTSFLYVSHFLDEVMDLTGEVTVLRDGRVVERAATKDLDENSMVKAIVGQELLEVERGSAQRPEPSGVAALEVVGLRSPGNIDGVSFGLQGGEILGLAGLLGSGRSEILHAIFGADPHVRGTVRVGGRELSRSTSAAVEAGVALVPEDRVAQGLVMGWDLKNNTSLPDLDSLAAFGTFPSPSRERERASAAIDSLGIVASGPDAEVAELSGGNAQKVVFAKWLFGDAGVFLLDEPTAGVDIGAKVEILRLIREFADDGKAVVVVSSEFEELLAVATRILVVYGGRIVAEREPASTSVEELLALASGFQKEGDGD